MFNILKNRIRKKRFNLIKRIENKYKFIQKRTIFSKKIVKISLGKKNKSKEFYIIKRYPGGGFFSNLIYILKCLNLKNHGMHVLVDMQYFPNKYSHKKNINDKKNVWEVYFNQLSNYKLSEVYQSKNVYFSPENIALSLNDYNSSKLRLLYEKHIRINKSILNIVKKFEKKNFKKNSKIIGVHFRGTDQKITPNHFLPPTYYQIIEKIDNLIKSNNVKKIFLVTEQNNYLEKLKKRYGKLLCFCNSFRADNIQEFNNSKRRYHRNKLGIESLTEAILLSKCDFFIYGRSNISSFVKFITKKKIQTFEIDNGKNSTNLIIAFFKWRFKILPLSYLNYYKQILFNDA